MYRFITILCFTFPFLGLFSQQKATTIVLGKSAITQVATVSLKKITKKASIQQSVGQSSVIGTIDDTAISVQQGFLNNTLYFSFNNIDKESFKESFNVTISPNPFSEFIKIDFSVKTQHPIDVQIFDMNGKRLFNKQYSATKTISIPLKNFSNSNYLVTINSGGKAVGKKIIKATR